MEIVARRGLCFLVFTSFGLVSCDLLQTESTGEIFLKLQHSLDLGATWEDKGTINVHNSRSGSATLEQSGVSESFPSDLAQLCAKGQLYLVRATGAQDILRSFTSACLMLEPSLSEVLTVQLDVRGTVQGINLGFSPLTLGGKRQGVVVVAPESGPVPDTQQFIQRMEEDKRRKEKGEEKDNRSFLAKYWMYIVPVVLFMAFNGAAAPEGGQGGGGGGR